MPAVALAIACVTAAGPFDGRPIVAVTVTGVRHIAASVVTEQIQIRPGQPYSQDVADQDLIRLERLRIFSDISITPSASDEGVRVEVHVTETPRLVPAMSLAITDESGVSAGPAIKLLNLGGHPVNVSAATQFGGEQLVAFSEVSPLFTRHPVWHSANVSLRDRTNTLETFHERSLDFDARVGMHGNGIWQAGAIVQLYTVHADDNTVTLSGTDSDSFAGVGGVFVYDSRNSLTTTTRGWWNTVDVVRHAGSGSYTTLNLDLRRYSVIASRHSLLTTALLTLQSGEPGVDVPNTPTMRSAGKIRYAAGILRRAGARTSSSPQSNTGTWRFPLGRCTWDRSTCTWDWPLPFSQTPVRHGTGRQSSRRTQLPAEESACVCSFRSWTWSDWICRSATARSC